MLAYRVGVPLVYKLATCVQWLIDLPEKFRQIITFYGWAMPYRTSDLCRVKAL